MLPTINGDNKSKTCTSNEKLKKVKAEYRRAAKVKKDSLIQKSLLNNLPEGVIRKNSTQTKTNWLNF
jgi:hypothetical protein